ncbi:hypothetical protein Plhal304r1_c031g0101691 [Plasmopara halstedii]
MDGFNFCSKRLHRFELLLLLGFNAVPGERCGRVRMIGGCARCSAFVFTVALVPPHTTRKVLSRD